MNVASLDLCKELYELSGWDSTSFYWDAFMQVSGEIVYPNKFPTNDPIREEAVPAYDTGYLLRKLPNMIRDDDGQIVVTNDPSGGTPFGLTHCEDGSWFADYQGYIATQAVSPEDACAKLALDLFKQGVLK